MQKEVNKDQLKLRMLEKYCSKYLLKVNVVCYHRSQNFFFYYSNCWPTNVAETTVESTQLHFKQPKSGGEKRERKTKLFYYNNSHIVSRVVIPTYSCCAT